MEERRAGRALRYKEDVREQEARTGTYDTKYRRGIIERARLRRLNPTAFSSEVNAVKGLTGQEARITPEELDIKQREESRRQLGDVSKSAQPRNFVVEKPLKPSPLDIYGAEKEAQRSAIRSSGAFAPVQKL